jgi:uncharacterized phage protein gp47/JayE
MPNITTDFSGRDYTSNYEWLLTLLQQDVPEFTDFNHSDAGISLIRLLSREGDLLNYYLDEAFSEGFQPTARFKQSLIELGKLVDCSPKLASAAIAVLVLTRIDDSYYNTQPITIPRGTIFRRTDGVAYTCLEETVMPVGTNTVSITVIQGQLITRVLSSEDFTETDLTGHPKFNLGKNVAARTATLSHNDGFSIWSEVDSFFRSFSSNLHFKLELYADEYNGQTDTVFLVLGNGEHGSSVPDSSLSLSFIKTDGPTGNTGANTITEIEGNLNYQITCSNLLSVSGGGVPEDIESFRRRLPFMVRAQQRGVTREDYETLVSAIAGVADCQTLDRNQAQDYPWEYIAIHVVPEGGGPLSDNLNAVISSQLLSSGCLGGWRGRYVLLNAIPVTIPISCRINVAPGYSAGPVQTALYSTIAGLFVVRRGVIGNNFSFSTLNVAAGRTPGLNWIEFDTPTTDVVIGYGEYPVLGDISITVVP